MDDDDPLAGRAEVNITIVWQESDWSACPVRSPAQAAFSLKDQNAPVVMVCRTRVPEGQPAEAVIESQLTAHARECLTSGTHGVAIFGRKIRARQLIDDGDRIELLGPITADVKSQRRRRVTAHRQQSARSPWKK